MAAAAAAAAGRSAPLRGVAERRPAFRRLPPPPQPARPVSCRSVPFRAGQSPLASPSLDMTPRPGAAVAAAAAAAAAARAGVGGSIRYSNSSRQQRLQHPVSCSDKIGMHLGFKMVS
ncbi:uncharacterized protein LOC126335976 [Schistocerca gregaria]|uniref:uncharacterized protein LOC126335976 n=1 Tax=Schistocerca gregaria TaxID=7010 RepID=UPI00211E515B|nr:uncharacterized protein LOC126335976 [Schistocerca gregaria]